MSSNDTTTAPLAGQGIRPLISMTTMDAYNIAMYKYVLLHMCPSTIILPKLLHSFAVEKVWINFTFGAAAFDMSILRFHKKPVPMGEVGLGFSWNAIKRSMFLSRGRDVHS